MITPPPVQYARPTDGYDVAYTVCGEGISLLFYPPGFLNVHLLWRIFPEWMQGLAKRFKLICFDSRGEGFSTRGLPANAKLEDFAKDAEAIINLFPGERFVLYGIGGRGQDAIRMAHERPDRVQAVVWNIAHVRQDAWPTAMFIDVAKQNWSVFMQQLAPRHVSLQEQHFLIREMKRCITFEDWWIWIHVYVTTNVEEELKQLRPPILVLHPRGFEAVKAEHSREAAAIAPNGRFVPIEGHWLFGDPREGLSALDSFMESLNHRDPTPDSVSPANLSARELEVLRLVAAGMTNQQIADTLFISPSTAAKHVTSILAKTESRNRAEAASYAHKHQHIV